MFNIFLVIFFSTLAFACFEPYFFIGYLISIALFGLYQAIFMANAGGAWDNAKKLVETELQAPRAPTCTPPRVVGDTVGDPFKDTSSVAHEPGHQVHHALRPAGRRAGVRDRQGRSRARTSWARPSTRSRPTPRRSTLSAVFFVISMFFVYRSFYGMRIETGVKDQGAVEPVKTAA